MNVLYCCCRNYALLCVSESIQWGIAFCNWPKERWLHVFGELAYFPNSRYFRLALAPDGKGLSFRIYWVVILSNCTRRFHTNLLHGKQGMNGLLSCDFYTFFPLPLTVPWPCSTHLPFPLKEKCLDFVLHLMLSYFLLYLSCHWFLLMLLCPRQLFSFKEYIVSFIGR